MDAIAPLGRQDRLQVTGNRQDHVFLNHLAADRAWVDPAMPGIDHDLRLGVSLGAPRCCRSGLAPACRLLGPRWHPREEGLGIGWPKLEAEPNHLVRPGGADALCLDPDGP